MSEDYTTPPDTPTATPTEEVSGIDTGALATVVQVPGNEPTPTPNPVEPEVVDAPNPFAALATPEPVQTSWEAPFPVVTPDPVAVEPTTVPDPTPVVVHPTTQVQPLGVTPGISSPDITLSQVEPGIRWAIANGLLSVDDLAKAVGEHVRELFKEYV